MRIEDLVIARHDNEGVSYRSLSAIAAAAGHPVRFQTWQALRHGTILTFPGVDTIRGITAALSTEQAPVTHTQVVLAIATTLGLDIELPHEVEARLAVLPCAAGG